MPRRDIFNMSVGKNCSFKAKNFNIVVNYMNKTKRSFSETINIILEEWNKYGIVMRQYQKQEELKQMEAAKTINPMDDRSKMDVKRVKREVKK